MIKTDCFAANSNRTKYDHATFAFVAPVRQRWWSSQTRDQVVKLFSPYLNTMYDCYHDSALKREVWIRKEVEERASAVQRTYGHCTVMLQVATAGAPRAVIEWENA